MCLIIAKPKGIDLPKREYLENGLETNRDGIGVGVRKEGANEILIKKDFVDIDDFYPWLINNVTKEDTLIIHFRMATSGLKDEGNRHPFPITDDKILLRQTNLLCQQAVAHNGIMREYSNHATFNDTQKFIMDILSDMGIKENLKNPTIQKLLKSYLKGDKIAIMLSDGDLILLGDFNETDGINYSTYSYKYSWRRTNQYQYTTGYYGRAAWKRCENCQLFQEDVKELFYKKVKLELCKLCRKKLNDGTLEDFINLKKAQTTSLFSYINNVKCNKCYKMVEKNTTTYLQFGLYICEECEKTDNQKMKCAGCDKEFDRKDMKQEDECIVCINCYNDLHNLGVISQPQVKTGLEPDWEEVKEREKEKSIEDAKKDDKENISGT